MCTPQNIPQNGLQRNTNLLPIHEKSVCVYWESKYLGALLITIVKCLLLNLYVPSLKGFQYIEY